MLLASRSTFPTNTGLEVTSGLWAEEQMIKHEDHMEAQSAGGCVR